MAGKSSGVAAAAKLLATGEEKAHTCDIRCYRSLTVTRAFPVLPEQAWILFRSGGLQWLNRQYGYLWRQPPEIVHWGQESTLEGAEEAARDFLAEVNETDGEQSA